MQTPLSTIGSSSCSDADGMSISDVDWTSHDGHYRVQVRGEWVDVPDDAVLTSQIEQHQQWYGLFGGTGMPK
jgi:hypothetical protein